MKKKAIKNKKETQKNNEIEKNTNTQITASIVEAYKSIEEEKVNKTKSFLNWIQSIVEGLMLLFTVCTFLFGWIFFQPIKNNILNGHIFNIINLAFFIDAIGVFLFGIYTYKVKEHVDEITSISDLTGICSFILSLFALIVALLALMLQIQKGV